jgi:hypothetical protein
VIHLAQDKDQHDTFCVHNNKILGSIKRGRNPLTSSAIADFIRRTDPWS